MIPQRRRHAEIAVMGQVVMARMAQPRPIKIGAPVEPPMMGRIVDEDVPKVASDEARRRRGA